MLLKPITYGKTDTTFVSYYELIRPHYGDFWTHESCKYIKSRIKKYFRTRQGNACCYCRQINTSNHGASWHTEHIVPRATHPEFMFNPSNLAVACPDCNGFKSNKQTLQDANAPEYPRDSASFLIIHPQIDLFEKHIRMSKYSYFRLSDKGEWTINACNLNRLALQQFGWDANVSDRRYESEVEDMFRAT